MVADAIGTEKICVCCEQMGWTTSNNVCNVPNFYGTGGTTGQIPYLYSGVNRVWAATLTDVFILNLGGNDYSGVSGATIQAAVVNTLGYLRPFLPADCWIWVIGDYSGYYQNTNTSTNYIKNGVSTYVAANGDPLAQYLNIGLTTVEEQAMASVYNGLSSSYISLDCVHPTPTGHGLIAGKIVAAWRAAKFGQVSAASLNGGFGS